MEANPLFGKRELSIGLLVHHLYQISNGSYCAFGFIHCVYMVVGVDIWADRFEEWRKEVNLWSLFSDVHIEMESFFDKTRKPYVDPREFFDKTLKFRTAMEKLWGVLYAKLI